MNLFEETTTERKAALFHGLQTQVECREVVGALANVFLRDTRRNVMLEEQEIGESEDWVPSMQSPAHGSERRRV